MRTSPTMKDVARVAGVGLKTVSRYVNGETNIDPQLAARISGAIGELGYRRNLAAASIRPGWTSRMIGLVISDLANPFYSTLTRSIEQAARDRGYLLISASSEENGAIFDRLVDRLMEQRVDGLIVVPPKEEGRSWADVVPPIPPLVVLDRPLETKPTGQAPADTMLADPALADPALAGPVLADTIIADNAGGAEAATRMLIERGGRRVAFVGDSLRLYTMQQRYAGYQAALAAAELESDSDLVAFNAHSQEQAAGSVLSLLEADNVDAIFAANNRAAIGALFAFAKLGRRLPMIAFDDFEAAQLISPPISVVSQNIAEMGRLAAERVIERAAGGSSPATTTVLETSLILRGSELPTP